MQRGGVERVDLARAEQRSAADVAPGADHRGQTAERPHRHAAAAMALHAVVEPNQRWPNRAVLLCQPLDIGHREARDRSDALRRVFPDALAQLGGAEAVAREVIVILQAVAPEDVHDAEREGSVGAGADRQPPVALLGGLAAEGVDGHDAGAGLAGAMHQRPQVHVRDARVGAPVDDVARMDHRFGVDVRSRPERDIAAGRPRRGADRPVEQRRPEPLEETPIEALALELAHRAGIAVRQNRLGAVRRVGNGAETAGNQLDRLIPADAAEFAMPLGSAADHRILQPARMVNSFQVARHFLAEESIRERMVRVAAQPGCPPILHRHEHAARVGTVVRADDTHRFRFVHRRATSNRGA